MSSEPQATTGQEVSLLPDDNNADKTTTSANASNRTSDTQQQQLLQRYQQQSYVGAHRFLYKMYKLLKEIGLIVLFTITYAAFTNNPPKVSKSPPAFPFFGKGSMVTDWYRGQLSEAIEQAGNSDVAFVMYYAPWDAESQLVRYEFEVAAILLHKQVTFAAINCWHPGSECRTQYNQVFSWPVLMAYAAHTRGVQFRGPRTAAHMIKFLQAVSNPLTRISDSSQLNLLLANHDAVVVGTVNSLPGSSEYGVLYTTALRFLDRDPLAEVAFAVRTEPQRDIYGEQTLPLLTMHLWNETLIYPSDQEWKTELLMAWIADNLHQVSLWAALPGSKSRTLAPYLQPGPTLILFTPQNPLQGFNDYYDLLREVALQYYNCDQKPWIQNQVDLIRNKRQDNYDKYHKLLDKCAIKKSSSRNTAASSSSTSNITKKNRSFATVVTYSSMYSTRWINSSCCLSLKDKHKSTCLPCPRLDKELPPVCQSVGEECDADIETPLDGDTCSEKSTATKTEREEYLESSNNDYRSKISMLTGYNDNRSPKNLQQHRDQEQCRNLHLAYRLLPALFTDLSENVAVQDVAQGLACQTNASLSIIALDSSLYYLFAEGLGIDVMNTADETAVVIVNDKLETHYFMSGAYNRPNLQKFVANFTKNSLSRLMTSASSTRKKHTHLYPVKRDCDGRRSTNENFCIPELNTETFLPTILKRNVAAVVLYYSLQCAFCSGISFNFLTAAKSFANLTELQFYRIDGDRNGLPWAFTMDQFPTVLFFPAKRKSESRVFPRDMPISVPNLINFILVNMEPNLRLHAMWTLCNQSQFPDDKQHCLKKLGTESLELTNAVLKEWRNAESLRRPFILHRLQILRQISLLLAHKSYDFRTIEKQMRKLHTMSHATHSRSANENDFASNGSGQQKSKNRSGSSSEQL